MKRSKSMLQTFLFGTDESEEDIKCKNIRQTGNAAKYFIYFIDVTYLNMSFYADFYLLRYFTEILVDLREAVLQVARHFINLDPKLGNVGLTPDYTMESHAKDHDNYINVSRTRKRRAKALLGKNF